MADPPDLDMDIEDLLDLPHDQFVTVILLSIATQLTKLTKLLHNRELGRKG